MHLLKTPSVIIPVLLDPRMVGFKATLKTVQTNIFSACDSSHDKSLANYVYKLNQFNKP